MPFETVDTQGNRPTTTPAVSREISTREVVSGFLEQENVVNNAAEMLTYWNAFEDDPEYDPFDDMAGYEGFADRLSTAGSNDEMIHRKQRIDERNEAMQNFADSSVPQKFLSVGTMIATDPTTLIPIGGVAHKTYRLGGRILEGGAKTAGIAAAVETGREALLQYNQDTRTVQEGLFNVVAATVVSGILGGAISGLTPPQLDELVKRYDDEMITPDIKVGLGDGTGGAMRTGQTFEDTAEFKPISSFDAEEIAGLTRTKKVFEKIPGFLKNPVWESAVSQSTTVRQLNEKLSDLSLVKNKNIQGVASEQSVELGIKMYDTLRVSYHKDANKLWKDYSARAKAGLPVEQQIGSKPGGRMTRREFDEAIGKAGRRKDMHLVPEVQASAQSIRKNVFDPVLKRAEEVGIFKNVDEIDIKTADSWLKRVYDKDKIVARRGEFKQRVLTWLKDERNKADPDTVRAGRLDEELDNLSEEIIDRITNVTQGRLPYDHQIGDSTFKKPAGARGSAKQRVFAIPDEAIEDFLISDINEVMESHLRTMAPDNELMGKFGTLDFDEIKKTIQDDYNRIRNKAEDDAALAKIEKEFKKDVRNVEAMWDKLRGQFAQPDDYSAPAHVLERTGMAWNFVRLLGDVVASSIPDMGRQVMVHGFNRSYGDLFRTLATDVKGLKMAAGEMQEIGLALDITNSVTALKRANMDEYMPVTGKIDAFTQKTSTLTATAIGINHWNATQKTFAGVMTQNRMLGAIQDLGAGKTIKGKELTNLAAHGIDAEMAKRISKQFSKHGEKRKVLRIANARAWDDVQARLTFQAAIRKQVDEIIITPGLDRPLWLSKPGWRTLGQFKSFSFSSTQRTTLAGIQSADANTLAGAGVSIFLGSMVYAYKNRMAGRDVSDDPRVWITEGVDRSGIAGIFFDVNNMMEKASGGAIGVNRFVGGPPMSRYQSRNTLGALMGPSFGAAQTILGVTSSAATGDWEASDTHAVRRLMPGQNIPYMRHILDSVEKGANSAMGVPD